MRKTIEGEKVVRAKTWMDHEFGNQYPVTQWTGDQGGEYYTFEVPTEKWDSEWQEWYDTHETMIHYSLESATTAIYSFEINRREVEMDI